MNQVRIGVVGLGGMGTNHATYLSKGEVAGAVLAAVSDVREERLLWAKENLNDELKLYSDWRSMLRDNVIDAVIIATPHYAHPEIAIEAFRSGLHVLCEKPAGVYTKHVRQMNEAARESGKTFSMMYNQRTFPVYQKLRDLVMSGEVGEIRRTNWIITDWYRTQSYYDSGTWRATWEGEGGGVLINQAPHNLDLWQWTTGLMPKRMRAFCYFGKYRNIEVEDEVTAFVEYENGATGVFITTTGETPGSNRFEIVGDRGKLVVENGILTFWRLRTPESQFNREQKEMWGAPECWKCEIPTNGPITGYQGVSQNWVDAILYGKPLLAPGEEGINGLLLSNAMLLSTWTDGWVDFPFDEDLFYEMLQERAQKKTDEQQAAIGQDR